MEKEYTVSQTHPNHGYLYVNNSAFQFHVNNTIAPGIESSLKKVWSFFFGDFENLDDAAEYVINNKLYEMVVL